MVEYVGSRQRFSAVFKLWNRLSRQVNRTDTVKPAVCVLNSYESLQEPPCLVLIRQAKQMFVVEQETADHYDQLTNYHRECRKLRRTTTACVSELSKIQLNTVYGCLAVDASSKSRR